MKLAQSAFYQRPFLSCFAALAAGCHLATGAMLDKDADLAALIGRPVRLANDADCFALSEAVDGAGRGARSVFGVIIGTGVGGGADTL